MIDATLARSCLVVRRTDQALVGHAEANLHKISAVLLALARRVVNLGLLLVFADVGDWIVFVRLRDRHGFLLSGDAEAGCRKHREQRSREIFVQHVLYLTPVVRWG